MEASWGNQQAHRCHRSDGQPVASPEDRPSLAQVTRFGPSVSLVPQDRFDLNWVNPFLALPHVRSFRGPSCVAIGDDGHKTIPSNFPEAGFGKTLIVVDLVACCIDEVGIDDFLRHTTRLRTLRYSHLTKAHSGPPEWNICRFITAIGRAVGGHLEELSVFIRDLRGPIAPGKVSMRGFERLRKLEFPLEIAACNITAATPNRPLMIGGGSTDEHHELDDDKPFISDLVPASVSRLSLFSGGTDDRAKTLDVMFRHFTIKRESMLPALKEIRMSCPTSADDAYKEQYARLLAETVKVGVVSHVNRWPSSVSITWDVDQ